MTTYLLQAQTTLLGHENILTTGTNHFVGTWQHTYYRHKPLCWDMTTYLLQTLTTLLGHANILTTGTNHFVETWQHTYYRHKPLCWDMTTYLLQTQTTVLGHENILTMTGRWGWAPSTGRKTFYFSRSKYPVSVLTRESEPTNMFSKFQKSTIWEFVKNAPWIPSFWKKTTPFDIVFF